jgi:hypothetical protein
MIAVPIDTPVTTPDDGFTVATETLLLLHTPPLIALVSVADVPGHACGLPPIVPGTGKVSTVIDKVVSLLPQVFVTV